MSQIFVWTLSDFIGIAFGVLLIFAALAVTVITMVKQRFCKHGSTYENRACDEICRRCGKNLGFIGRKP